MVEYLYYLNLPILRGVKMFLTFRKSAFGYKVTIYYNYRDSDTRLFMDRVSFCDWVNELLIFNDLDYIVMDVKHPAIRHIVIYIEKDGKFTYKREIA